MSYEPSGPQGPAGPTGTAFQKSFYNASVNFAAGDYLSLYFTTNSSLVEDVAVQLDCF